ncbi:ATP-binding cassette domain-containing protein [Streptomyces sp. 21So2-11]|uniref:ATP-binding cassette domain-containing protein n=1 Tax=Streptomyces sp. 21So2-11 TaxID=3144408 RepID=UPI00321931EE
MAGIDNPIAVQALTKSFGEVAVLKGIDFSVEHGTMFALLGPNGSGKTTIVRILSTLLSPDSGTALVNGYDVSTQARAVRGVIGLTGQYSAVDQQLSGHENLVMMGRLYHHRRPEAKRRADRLIERFDLVEAAGRAVKTYSGGMRRRLDLAASLISEPPVIFLDEPTTGLDPRSRATMWDIIRDLLRDGVTILLTTQYLEEADQLADRVGVLNEGTIVATGRPAELKQRAGKERLELSFSTPEDLATAVRVLDGRADVLGGAGSSLGTPVDGPRHLKWILDQIYDVGVEVESVTLSKPTLDDVFLALTGKQTASRAAEVTSK